MTIIFNNYFRGGCCFKGISKIIKRKINYFSLRQFSQTVAFAVNVVIIFKQQRGCIKSKIIVSQTKFNFGQ